MKKAIIALFTLLFIISVACTGGVETTPMPNTEISISPTSEVSEDNSMTINIPIIHKSPTQWNFEIFREKYDELDAWYEVVKNKFNIDLAINYIPALYAYDIANSKYYIEKISSNEMSGLILVENGNFNNIPDLRAEGLIEPLDEYLSDNYVFNTMPEEMKNAYRMPDGQIWALPAGYNNALYIRYINKKWLDKMELSVPDSLDTFYEVAKAFAYDDPNGNGINDEKGLAGKNWDGPQIFGDIFLAHDCYLSSYFYSSVAYDHTTGAYEDAALKPEMLDALTYIKVLLHDKIARIMQNYDYRTNGTSGSFYTMNTEERSAADWEFMYSIIPDKQYSVMGKGPEKCFVLTHNTDNAKESINTFVNSFYTDIDGAALGRLGLPDKNYSIEDRVLTIGDQPYIDITGKLPYVSINYIDAIKTPAGQTLDTGKAHFEEYNSLYNNNRLIVDVDFMPDVSGTNLQWMFGDIFTWYFLEVFDSMTTEEFLSYYKSEAKKLGIQDILNSLNEEAGTTAKYIYH